MRKTWLFFSVLCSVLGFSNGILIHDFRQNRIENYAGSDFEFKRDRIFELGKSETFLLSKENFNNSDVVIEGYGAGAVFIDSKLVLVGTLPVKLNVDGTQVDLRVFSLGEENKVEGVVAVQEVNNDVSSSRFFPRRRVAEASGFAYVSIFLFLALVCMNYFFPELYRADINDLSKSTSYNSSWMMFFVTIATLSLITFLIFIKMEFRFYSSLLDFLGVGVILFLSLQVKRGLGFLFAKVFDIGNWVRIQYFESLKVLAVGGGLVFCVWYLIIDDVLVTSLLLVFICVWWLVKSFVNISKNNSVSLLRNISYLCAAELIPVSVVFSVMSNF